MLHYTLYTRNKLMWEIILKVDALRTHQNPLLDKKHNILDAMNVLNGTVKDM